MHEDVVKEKDVLIVKVAKMDGIIDIHKKKTDTAEKKAAENKKVYISFVSLKFASLYLPVVLSRSKYLL